MRPGFVLEVDERTPPLLVHRGDGMSLERFPLGTRVVYPPEPLPGLRVPWGREAWRPQSLPCLCPVQADRTRTARVRRRCR